MIAPMTAMPPRIAIAELPQSLVNHLSETLTRAAEVGRATLEATAQQATDSIHAMTHQAIEVVSGTTEQAQAALVETLQHTEVLGDAVAQSVQRGISASIHHWLIEHPLIAWMLTHPLYLLGFGVLCILLLGGLFRLIGRLTEHAWWILLKLPVRLMRWAIQGILGLLRGKAEYDQFPEHRIANRQLDILARLDEIKREEAELIQELRSLLTGAGTESIAK